MTSEIEAVTSGDARRDIPFHWGWGASLHQRRSNPEYFDERRWRFASPYWLRGFDDSSSPSGVLVDADYGRSNVLTSKRCGGRSFGLIGEPDERLRLFLHDFVKSYEELEAVLFLAQNEGQEFSAAAVDSALNPVAGSLQEALEQLTQSGRLIQATRSSGKALYRYAPKEESTRQLVTELQTAYEERRMSVVQMLSANALERLRRAAMLRLADAFRLERGKK